MLARALCCAAFGATAASAAGVKCKGCYAPMSPKTPKCSGVGCFSPTLEIGGCWTIPMGVRSVSAQKCDSSGVVFYEYATKDCSGPVNTTATMSAGACANPAPGQAPAGVWASCECVADAKPVPAPALRGTAPRSRASLRITDCTPAGSPIGGISWTAPSEIHAGDVAEIKGSGTLTGATITTPNYEMTVTYLGLPVLRHSNSACGTDRVTLPLDMGTIEAHLLDCPAAAGPLTIEATIRVQLIPPGTIDTKITATGDGGEEIICLDAQIS